VPTARAERLARDGALAVARRRFRSLGEEPRAAAALLVRAPIVLLAVDLSQESEALTDAMRTIALRVLHAEPGARLACVTVLKISRIGMDVLVDDAGQSLHVRLLVELKHWTRPLAIAPKNITHHVLEAPDPAATIIEFARANNVDQIVIGSRGSSTLRRYLGSVSSQVVARAGCTVTVVKRAFRAAEAIASQAGEPGEPSFRRTDNGGTKSDSRWRRSTSPRALSDRRGPRSLAGQSAGRAGEETDVGPATR
jgi:eukaryotic-like serine/threonine-protein kinase